MFFLPHWHNSISQEERSLWTVSKTNSRCLYTVANVDGSSIFCNVQQKRFEEGGEHWRRSGMPDKGVARQISRWPKVRKRECKMGTPVKIVLPCCAVLWQTILLTIVLLTTTFLTGFPKDTHHNNLILS